MSTNIKLLLEMLKGSQKQMEILDNDPTLKALNIQLEEVKPQLVAILAQAVQRSYDLAPESIKPYIHHKMIVSSMMEGIYSDLCCQTMDQLNPDWEKIHYPSPEETIMQLMTESMEKTDSTSSMVPEAPSEKIVLH
ncbi:MAG: hypothetical protein EO766_17660 [Hydrotalea sp. AMD]|uniref:hypothetical protein n=1 Tax=Hydrotalea sp. AMD TaxID=2501297 RepID=UPI001026BC24|nr:hypothetical protein [Hydrotalea sp. AMD]RWZ83496.1 MAG: hypothetical protein EO766_17660 [Hydrotalea sp. AMD]